MALLEVTGISKNFGSTHVLQNISLNLEKGEALAIIGSSGSGKTTLLRCLNFLETPDTGVIRVDGKTLWDAADPATHRESEVRKKRLHFGLVFQNFNLFPQYTALQNITLAGELLAKEKPEYKANRSYSCGTGRKSPHPSGTDGPFGAGKPLPAPAFRRPATACGYCPRPGAGTGYPLL